jgi:hypothetical protein
MSGPSPGAMKRSSALGSRNAPMPTTDTVRPPLGVSKISSRERQLTHVTLPVATGLLNRTVTIGTASSVLRIRQRGFFVFADDRGDVLRLDCCPIITLLEPQSPRRPVQFLCCQHLASNSSSSHRRASRGQNLRSLEVFLTRLASARSSTCGDWGLRSRGYASSLRERSVTLDSPRPHEGAGDAFHANGAIGPWMIKFRAARIRRASSYASTACSRNLARFVSTSPRREIVRGAATVIGGAEIVAAESNAAKNPWTDEFGRRLRSDQISGTAVPPRAGAPPPAVAGLFAVIRIPPAAIGAPAVATAVLEARAAARRVPAEGSC